MTAPVADAHAVAPVPRPGPERPGADGPWGRSDPALAREWRGARFRGYARMDLARRRALVEMRGIDDPADPATGCRTLRSFEVVAGSGRLDG